MYDICPLDGDAQARGLIFLKNPPKQAPSRSVLYRLESATLSLTETATAIALAYTTGEIISTGYKLTLAN